jgi:hypothetical protein
MASAAAAAVYNFTNATTPALSTPVILEFDYNLYWDTAHEGVPQGSGWDTHSLSADPLLVGDAAGTPPWRRSAADLALAPASPAYALPGFRRIAGEEIGLGAAFGWDLAGWARRSGKVQAETYDRQVGLWREGSYGISPGPQGWAFAPGAWALYRRVDAVGAGRVVLRLAPLVAGLTVGVALGSPGGVVGTFSAAAAGAPLGVMATYVVQLDQAVTVQGGELFLLPSDKVVIDWWQLEA